MNTLERILQLAAESKMTNKAIEEATGISNGSFSKWKKGNYAPSADSVLKIATYFHVSTDYLFCLSDIREVQTVGISLTEHELLLLKAFREADAAGQQNIIFTCQLEMRKAEKGESVNVG